MKKASIRLLSLITISFLLISSCSHDVSEYTNTDPGNGNNNAPLDTLLCDSTNVSYPGTIQPIINTYCIICHSGVTPSGGLNFTDYYDVAFVAEKGTLLGSLKHLPGYSAMPQGGNMLSACEIALIEKWINDTTFITPPDTTFCDTSSVTYPGTIVPIFQANCISCHASPTPEAGIDLTNFETIAYIAQSGALIGAIRHQEGYTPMPNDGPPLTECEILKIEKWITDTTFTPNGSGGIPYDPDTVYFQNEVLPLLLSGCGISGCHDQATAQEDVILTSYYFVMQTAEVVPFEPWENDIIEKINATDPDDRMPPPPASPLTQNQKDMIYTWILQGALNNHFDVEDCDSVNVTFSGMVFPIIQNSCYGCHSGTEPQGGIHLTSYSQIAAVGAISPGNPGSLLGAVTWATGNTPMPKNGPHLSDCDIAQIKKWINAGMPDN